MDICSREPITRSISKYEPASLEHLLIFAVLPFSFSFIQEHSG